MQSKCSNCKNKTSRFIKEQDAKGLLSDLGINTPLGINLGINTVKSHC